MPYTVVASICIAGVILGSGCAQTRQTEVSETPGLAAYYIGSEDIPGWEATTPLSIHAADHLYNDINGAATQYMDLSVTRYFIEDMENDDKTLTIMVMEFPDRENAKAIFEKRKSEIYKSRSIPGFEEDVAIGSDALGAVSSYYWTDTLYFELVLSGYGKNLDMAANDTGAFLSFCETKLQKAVGRVDTRES